MSADGDGTPPDGVPEQRPPGDGAAGGPEAAAGSEAGGPGNGAAGSPDAPLGSADSAEPGAIGAESPAGDGEPFVAFLS
ncbi:MAG TPA: hypothetical protein VNK05_05990, partial [Chloroflexota bacterium]|nr:hypothetical protein [Chloroflexota bacterium]